VHECRFTYGAAHGLATAVQSTMNTVGPGPKNVVVVVVFVDKCGNTGRVALCGITIMRNRRSIFKNKTNRKHATDLHATGTYACAYIARRAEWSNALHRETAVTRIV
jgi:hypothetical protein